MRTKAIRLCQLGYEPPVNMSTDSLFARIARIEENRKRSAHLRQMATMMDFHRLTLDTVRVQPLSGLVPNVGFERFPQRRLRHSCASLPEKDARVRRTSLQKRAFSRPSFHRSFAPVKTKERSSMQTAKRRPAWLSLFRECTDRCVHTASLIPLSCDSLVIKADGSLQRERGSTKIQVEHAWDAPASGEGDETASNGFGLSSPVLHVIGKGADAQC